MRVSVGCKTVSHWRKVNIKGLLCQQVCVFRLGGFEEEVDFWDYTTYFFLSLDVFGLVTLTPLRTELNN